MALQEIPLNKLVLSSRNMRKGDVDVSDLVASFTATPSPRLLQNLVVSPQMKGKKASGVYEVDAGGRRWRALKAVAAMGRIPEDFPVPCLVGAVEDAAEASLTENYARLPPHPADVYEAFAELADKGLTEQQIAERYNMQDVGRVTRTLRLAKVSPRLFEMFRRDELNFEQMAALTLTDDHDLQERVALKDGKGVVAWKIKELLTAGEVSTSDRRVEFVGLDAYQQAGGAVRMDLFAKAEGTGYVTDGGLLERLALEKLEAARPAVEAEGWAWVEVMVSQDYSETQAYGRIYPEHAPLSPEAQAEIDELEAQVEAFYEDEANEDQEAPEEVVQAEQRIEELRSGAQAYSPAKMALAGALITVGNNGVASISRGMVRPADKRALAALEKGAEPMARSGGGEGKPDYSAALLANLTSHRTLALRVELAKRPDVALVAAVHSLLLVTHYRPASTYGAAPLHSPLTLTGRDWRTVDPFKFGEDIAASPAAAQLEALKAEQSEKLPEDAGELWDHLAERTQEELMGYLAYATADSLLAVQEAHSLNRNQARTADKIAEAVGLDMADYWTPTAAGYFSRIGKGQILAAITEGVSADVAGQLGGLKKGDLAKEAETRLEGRRWVPALFRTGQGDLAAQDASEGQDEDGEEGEGA